MHGADEALFLRTGDVIEILPVGPTSAPRPVRDQAFLRDYVTWAQGIRILSNILVRLWSPDWRRPIITWLHPEQVWQPGPMTFSGDFDTAYPGRWVPIIWSPSSILQLMQVSEQAGQVSVLYECSDITRAVRVPVEITGPDLARFLQAPSTQISVLGVQAVMQDEDLHLRDGDIVAADLSAVEYRPIYGWPDDEVGQSDIALPTGVALLYSPRPALRLFLFLLCFGGHSLAVRPDSRSRSPTPDSDEWRSGEDSPRLGRWRPDQTYPLADVLTNSRLDYQILCPFRGLSPPAYCFRDASGHVLAQEVSRWSSAWPVAHVVTSGGDNDCPSLLVPGGLRSIAHVLIHSPGQIFSRLVPRCQQIHLLLSYIRREVGDMEVGIHLPPALPSRHQAQQVVLRDGDSFMVFRNEQHAAYRAGLALPSIPLHRLPHLNVWHTPFKVSQGGWVYVWSPYAEVAHQPTLHWIHPGELWCPDSCQFRHARTMPHARRWVPTAWLANDKCHFVLKSEVGQACVLLHRTDGAPGTVCQLLNVRPGETGVPGGWCLRTDIQACSPVPQARDGDVLVPAASPARRRVHRYSRILQIAASGTFALFTRHAVWALVGGVLLQSELVLAMVESPEESTTGPARVGKYAWRVPEPYRVCDAAVVGEQQAVVISPYGGTSASIVVVSDTPIEEIGVQAAASEPAWSHAITPIWPAFLDNTLAFLPVAPCPELVCMLVVSQDWYAAYLLPRRADLAWILAVLRRSTPGPLLGLCPPPAVSHPTLSHNAALDWRDGDALLALPLGDACGIHVPPQFQTALHVRHAAFWAHDFDVLCPLPVVVWRPGYWPARTEMPPPAHWTAELQTFAGRFSCKYPGRWVPVPWAYSDEVHLCRRSDYESYVNVVIETLQGDKMVGGCYTVPSWTTAAAVIQHSGLEHRPLALLGHVPTAALPPLRDGDVLHQVLDDPSPPAGQASHVRPWGPVTAMLCAAWIVSGLRTPTYWIFVAVVAFVVAQAGPVPESAGHPERLHWVWSPYRGRLGPLPPDFSAQPPACISPSEPWWTAGYVLVSPAPSSDSDHWVPCSPASEFAVALIVGPPAPKAVLLPKRLSKRMLLCAVRFLFDDVHGLRGHMPQLASYFADDATLMLRDGDALFISSTQWRPALHRLSLTQFPNVYSARQQGCWSHALAFYGDCWVLLWRPGDTQPHAVRATGRQVWDPDARTLRPALDDVPEGWWPSKLGQFSSAEPLHLVQVGFGNWQQVPVFRSPPLRCTWSRQEEARPGDVVEDIRPAEPLSASGSFDLRAAPLTSRSRISGLSCLPLVITALSQHIVWHQRLTLSWGLALLSCYLAAYGSPPRFLALGQHETGIDLGDAAALTAQLHQYWWQFPLRAELPRSAPARERAAWESFPVWSGGVPESVLIATDGSGAGAAPGLLLRGLTPSSGGTASAGTPRPWRPRLGFTQAGRAM